MNTNFLPAAARWGLLLCWLASASVSAQGSARGLELGLRVGHSSQSTDPILTIDASFSNNHAHRRVVLRGEFGFGAHSGVDIEVTDPAGVTRKLKPMLGDFTLTDQQRNERVMFLSPGDGVRIVRRIHASDIRTISGKYRLRVLYRSPLPTEATTRGAPRGRPDDVEGLSVVSNTVEIELD